MSVMASQLTLFGDSTVNISQHGELSGSFYVPSIYAVMYMYYQRGVAVLGVWSTFAFHY